MGVLVLAWMVSAGQSGGLGWPLDCWAFSLSEGSCAAASAAAAPPSSTASAAAAGGTRATPLPELAEPSFPPKRPSGQHLNIGKNIWYLTRIYRPSREIYTESYFFTTTNVILSTKFSIYILYTLDILKIFTNVQY